MSKGFGVKKNKMEKRHKKALVLFIIIILLVVVDIIIEVCCKIFTPFLLADNIAIFIMTIVYVVFIILKKSLENVGLLLATIFVLLAGFIVKGVGFYLLNKNEQSGDIWVAPFLLLFGKFTLAIYFLGTLFKGFDRYD